MGGRDECRAVIRSVKSTPCHSDVKKCLELCHGSCSVLRLFAAVPVAKGDPASRPLSSSEALGDGMGTSWLFPPFESCQLKAQRSASRVPLHV